MFLLQSPSDETIEKFLAAQRDAPLSYDELGATRDSEDFRSHPRMAKYVFDHNRIELGRGAACFERAKQAVRAWKMFDVGWCRLRPEFAPQQVPTVVAIAVRHFGFWSLNAARIQYVVDEDEPGGVHRFGFAYGTVREHSEIGEERFSVEWNLNDDRVWYDLFAFSRPGHFLAKLGYPLARALQKRFARDSKQAMLRAVQEI